MNLKIILVDDEPMLLKSLKRELEPWCETNNISIETFDSAREALIYISENHSEIFLIISDLRMPTMKGSTFLVEVHEKYPYIKLFLLTAYSDISDIQEAITASIDRLLIKPWDHKCLIADLESTLKLYNTEKENLLLKEEINYNLKIAGEFQNTILSSPPLNSNNVNFDLIYEPLKQLKCGGDFYDFSDIDDYRKLIMLGDVSGHGIKPAFVTAMLKVLCSLEKESIYNKHIDLSKLVGNINHGLFRSLKEINNVIVTFTAAYIDQRNKYIEVVGAGQLPVYILRDKKLISLKSDDVVMGFIHDTEFKVIKEPIQSGDLIIMFTDGLIESEKSKTVVDTNRIRSLLITLNLGLSPAQRIFDCFKNLQKNKEFADDVTVIATRIL